MPRTGIRIFLLVHAILTAALAVNVLSPHQPQPGASGGGTHPLASPGSAGGRQTAALERVLGPKPTRRTTRAVERELRDKGYETGPVDGVADPVTRAAILAYEHDHGLPLTAEPSERLLAALLLGDWRAPPPRGKEEMSKEARDMVAAVQRGLQKLGYAISEADGVPGPETAHAIRQFEAQNSLPRTGRVSGLVLSRLTALTAGAPAMDSVRTGSTR